MDFYANQHGLDTPDALPQSVAHARDDSDRVYSLLREHPLGCVWYNTPSGDPRSLLLTRSLSCHTHLSHLSHFVAIVLIRFSLLLLALQCSVDLLFDCRVPMRLALHLLAVFRAIFQSSDLPSSWTSNATIARQ
jgi:hypothetical protein